MMYYFIESVDQVTVHWNFQVYLHIKTYQFVFNFTEIYEHILWEWGEVCYYAEMLPETVWYHIRMLSPQMMGVLGSEFILKFFRTKSTKLFFTLGSKETIVWKSFGYFCCLKLVGYFTELYHTVLTKGIGILWLLMQIDLQENSTYTEYSKNHNLRPHHYKQLSKRVCR